MKFRKQLLLRARAGWNMHYIRYKKLQAPLWPENVETFDANTYRTLFESNLSKVSGFGESQILECAQKIEKSEKKVCATYTA